MEQNKWQLPKKLRLTPAMREEAKRNQQMWAQNANVPFGSPSSAEQERSRAAIRVAELENVLKSENDSNSAIVEKLAENYAVLGRFDLAAKVTNDEAKRNEYVEILEAISRDDNEACNCAEHNIFVKKEIWSVKHNRTMPLIACANCGHLNAQSLPESVAVQRQKRRQALAEYKK